MAKNLKRKVNNPCGPRKVLRLEGEINEKDTVNDNQFETERDLELENGMSDDQDHDTRGGRWDGVDTNSCVPPTNFQTSRKPSIRDELRNIKEASDLFKSSSFKLQVDALLPNVRPKPSRIHPLERFLFTLHSFMKSLPSIEPQHPLEASHKLRETGVEIPYPLPLPTEETRWKVAFEAPSDITLVGSWANKISVKAKDERKYGVDVAVEMPSKLFQEKDYLNGRFFHKRAYYMATLASAIRKSDILRVTVEYQSQGEDSRLTKLVLTPIKDGSSSDFTRLNAEVCILPVLSTDSPIPLHRLSPNHSNLRVITTDEEAESKGEACQSSPLYNNALLRILAPKHQLLAIHNLQNDCPAFNDALTLLRIWANQRGYGVGTRPCIRGFEGNGSWWPCILALLLCGEESREGGEYTSGKRTVGKGLSSYQLFKAALEFLAKHNFMEGIFMKTNEGHRFLPEDFLKHHDAVFLDASSLTNYLATVPLGSLDLLGHDAAKTLEILNQPVVSGDPFTEVFLNDSRDLWTRFDVVLRINLASAKLQGLSIHSTIDAGSPAAALLSAIGSLLRRGLGDRCRAVTILHPSIPPRPTSQAHSSSPDFIYIGIVYNPQNAFRLVDHGPAADDPNKTALDGFKELWGDKSELRRFKDGRIVESVVWEVSTADERAHVPSKIVRYLLDRHFSVRECAIETWQPSFDAMLRLPSVISREYLSSGSSTGFKGALSAFDNLVKTIKSLDDQLPLSVLMVSPASESLRYTSVLSPVPLPKTLATILPPNARYLPTIDIVLEFEKSSRWPDDLKAVQTIKLAFFERLATALMESADGLIAKVVTGDGVVDSPIVDLSSLEIVTPDGWAFNARICHDREIQLLDRIIDGTANRLPGVPKNKEHKKTKEYHDALEARAVHVRRFIHAPRHHRAIAALCHHYSSFTGTVRLVKRWLASHWLLHSHISEEVVELICASSFLQRGRPLTADDQTVQHLVPSSKERGFATVVKFLKDWKWEDGLFVPLYGDAPSATPNESIQAGSGSVWRVCSEHDPGGNMWTSNGPDLVAANRVRNLAGATWSLLQQIELGPLDIRGLFIHPTNDYDFIVELEPLVLPRYLQNVLVDSNLLVKQAKYANQTENLSTLPGFDPAQLLLRDVQRTYSETFKTFYDPLGGDKFGGVWDPTLKTSRTFKVLGGFSSMPIQKGNDKGKEKDLVTLNKASVIAEIQRMGLGIIKRIIVAT